VATLSQHVTATTQPISPQKSGNFFMQNECRILDLETTTQGKSVSRCSKFTKTRADLFRIR